MKIVYKSGRFWLCGDKRLRPLRNGLEVVESVSVDDFMAALTDDDRVSDFHSQVYSAAPEYLGRLYRAAHHLVWSLACAEARKSGPYHGGRDNGRRKRKRARHGA